MLVFFYLFAATLFAGSIGAVIWGGRPEKVVAALYLVAFSATILVRSAGIVRYSTVETSVAVVDLSLFVALALAAKEFDRWWIPCAAAFQLLAVLSHLAKALNPNLWRLGYHLMETWSSLPVVALLVIGVWLQAGRRRGDSATSI